jgi:hypothetical protein
LKIIPDSRHLVLDTAISPLERGAGDVGAAVWPLCMWFTLLGGLRKDTFIMVRSPHPAAWEKRLLLVL